MCNKVTLAYNNVEQQRVEHVDAGAVGGEVANQDFLYFLEFCRNGVVVVLEAGDGEARRRLAPFKEALDVGEHMSVLVFHVAADLAYVFVVEFEDYEGYVGLRAGAYRLEEAAADVGKYVVEEVCVGVLEVAHKGARRDCDRVKRLSADEVCHSEKGVAVNRVG